MMINKQLLNNKWFYVSIIIILLFVLFSGINRTPEYITTTVTKTDTVYINKPYKEIVLKEIVKPKTVYVYKTDTIFREKIIHDTLFIGLELTKQKADIHTLTPIGTSFVNEYKIPDFKSLSIDYKGNLQIEPIKHPNRKKTWRTIGDISIFIGGVLIGNQLAK